MILLVFFTIEKHEIRNKSVFAPEQNLKYH